METPILCNGKEDEGTQRAHGETLTEGSKGAKIRDGMRAVVNDGESFQFCKMHSLQTAEGREGLDKVLRKNTRHRYEGSPIRAVGTLEGRGDTTEGGLQQARRGSSGEMAVRIDEAMSAATGLGEIGSACKYSL